METRRSRRRLADPVLPCAVVATADHSRTASEDCFGFLGVNRSFLNGFIARANLRMVGVSHVATSFALWSGMMGSSRFPHVASTPIT